jgi:hypothetical protein
MRRVIAAGVLAAVCGSTVAAAGADDVDPQPLDPSDLAADGLAFEELLDTVGLGAAWRSATGIGPRARAVAVVLDESSDATLTALVLTVGELADTNHQRTETTQLVLDAAAAIVRAVERELDATVARNIARHQLGVINAILRIVAVDLFEVAYDADDEMFALEPDTLRQALRTREITESTLDIMIARKVAAEEELSRREQALIDAIREHGEREAEHAVVVEHQSELTMVRTGLDEDARHLIAGGAEAWVLSMVVGAAHITPRALDAYFRAEQITTLVDPACRISWATIAAISAVEGRHGTHAGASLRFDGTSDPRIIGLALDGEAEDNYGNPLANIPDTDGGRHDGDRVLDRAVGPMQFIPQTWERWARDGDGDGEQSPHDLDDATVAAAAYLCTYGSQRSWENWVTAVYAYNHSSAYVGSVKASLDRIAGLALPNLDNGTEWQPTRPAGVYVPPPPDPEPEPEGEEPAEGLPLPSA